jgi:sugar/nucleoside kinase (ribokinase family)
MADTPIIVVSGAASVDITIRNPPLNWYGGAGADSYTPGLIKRIEEPVEMVLGGNGAAAAYVIAKLGVRARLSSSVGNDSGGQLVRRWLEDAGVELLTAPTPSTMFAFTAVDDGGRRSGCLQYPGPPIDWQAAAQCDGAWLLIATHAQASLDDYRKIVDSLEHARRDGRRTAFDCGISWLGKMPETDMQALWQHTDLVIGTNDELGAWAKCTDPERIAERVLDHGPQQVIVKLGADGAAAQGQHEPFVRQPAHKLKCADVTIGAGDGFNGGALAALATGQSLSAAVDAGQKVASLIVQSGRGVIGWGDGLN